MFIIFFILFTTATIEQEYFDCSYSVVDIGGDCKKYGTLGNHCFKVTKTCLPKESNGRTDN